ncbi:MAG: hypothetical protein J0647_06795, partial [Campylobacteraceae bacterium]|nr:hypothetical protein [Campylobacteraceae bacterium]
MKKIFFLNYRSSKLALMSVFILSFILTSAFVFYLNSLELAQEKTKISNIAASYSYDLKSNLDRALSSSYMISALLHQGDGKVRDF